MDGSVIPKMHISPCIQPHHSRIIWLCTLGLASHSALRLLLQSPDLNSIAMNPSSATPATGVAWAAIE